ncbi:hypothetical protein KY311_05060 [Candidatus Woesearchaeota archaeon]|nr:hypothetical protein [Candidatus Woesearchaeota archaeon]MBW3017066.1 hypothetical protein [Candidatus Woesearchaeota archaeon]
MNKRGITLSELVVLLAVVVPLIILVGLIVSTLFTGSKLDQGTVISIRGFKEAVKGLEENKKIDGKEANECYIAYSVQDDEVFAGFNKVQAPIKDEKGNILNKPDICRKYSCIALCNVGNFWDWNNDDADAEDCTGKKRIAYYNFEKVDNFILKKDGKSMNLMLYSNLMTFDYIKIKKIPKAEGRIDVEVEQYIQGGSVKPCAMLS